MQIPHTTTQKEKAQYKKNIRMIKHVLSGKGKNIMQKLEKEMAVYSKNQQYEKAAEARDQLYALQNIFSHQHVIQRDEAIYAHKGISYLRQILALPHDPKRIEAYDISNIQGKFATGSMVVFTDGKPDKQEYRKFNIQLQHTPNDVAMIKEIISRRLQNDWTLPNVMVIDGGKAQRNTAGSALRNFQSISKSQISKKLNNVKVISLAKREEELYLPNGKIIELKKGPPALLHLLQYIRNEAHRFAISHHRKRRARFIRTYE